MWVSFPVSSPRPLLTKCVICSQHTHHSVGTFLKPRALIFGGSRKHSHLSTCICGVGSGSLKIVETRQLPPATQGHLGKVWQNQPCVSSKHISGGCKEGSFAEGDLSLHRAGAGWKRLEVRAVSDWVHSLSLNGSSFTCSPS